MAFIPLNSAQRGVWFAQHRGPSVPLTIALYIDLKVQGDALLGGAHEPVDVAILADACRQTAREYRINGLRAVEIDGEPFLAVDDTAPDELIVVDLRGEADPVRAAHEWMKSEYSARIDVLRERLAQTALLRLSDSRVFWYSRIHHLALDGYAALAFIERVAHIYTAAIQGMEPEPIALSDPEEVLASDREYRQSPRWEQDRAYWQQRMTAAPPAVTLAGAVAPAQAHSLVHGAAMSPLTEVALRQASYRLGGSSAPMLVSALAAYLALLTGDDELMLAMPVAARVNAVLRRAGNMLANAVPLRIRVDPNDTVQQFVTAVRAEIAAAMRHQRYRIEDLCRDAKSLGVADVGEGLGRGFGPGVNLMLFRPTIALGSVGGALHVLTTGPVDDLMVNFYPGGVDSRLHIDFEANPARYSEAELAQHYSRFLEFFERFIVVPAGTRLAELSVLRPSETVALVPSRGKALPEVRLLPDLLAQGVVANPAGVAVREGATELTYAELDAQSSQLARLLIAHGAGPERAVAVALGRTAAAIVALWAAAKAGALFVPVDAARPAAVLRRMVSAAPVVVGLCAGDPSTYTTEDSSGTWMDFGDALRAARTHSDAPVTDRDRTAPLRPANGAYLIYTSGSTGEPKAVVVTHTGLAGIAAAAHPQFAVDPASTVLRLAAPGFDAAMLETVLAFSSGATMCVAPTGVIGGAELSALIRSHQVTHLLSTPAVIASVDSAALRGVKVVVSGGDVCPPDLPGRAGRLFNSYGLTEATVVSTVSRPLRQRAQPVIGCASAGAQLLVLDRRLRPVPIGVPGELYLAGPALARGYQDLPGLTAARFVADPFGSSGQRLYRTGDCVRWTPDLSLEFLGRNDHQVKVRGTRVDPAEVDAVLLGLPAVDFAVTVGHGGLAANSGDAGRVLVSYVCSAEGRAIDPAALRVALAEFLSPQLIPAQIIVLDRVPLTSSGKVDRSQLPAPRDGLTYRAPETEREKTVARYAAAVLGLAEGELNAEASLFLHGLDSLSAVTLAAALRQAGLDATARLVFEHPTIARIARVVGDLVLDTSPATPTAPMGGLRLVNGNSSNGNGFALDALARQAGGPVPLTPMMHWFLEPGRFPDAAGFAQVIALAAPADLRSMDDLVAALALLIDQHEMLRAVVADAGTARAHVDIRPVGTVDPTRLATHVRLLRGEAMLENALEGAADTARAQLDPSQGVMLHAMWLDQGRGGAVVLAVHHLAVDMLSWQTLVRDLAAVWAHIARGSELPLRPTSATSFRQWARALESAARRPETVAELDHWEHALAGVVAVPGAVGTEVGHKRFTVPLGEALPPQFVLRAHTLASLLLAVRMANGSPHTAVMVEGHGREEELLLDEFPNDVVPDLSGTVGWFTAAYPLRVDLTGIDVNADDAVELAARRLRQAADSVPRRGIGFGLARYLNPQTRAVLTRYPNPQIVFNYLGRAVPKGSRGEWSVRGDVLELNKPTHPRSPLEVNVTVNARHDGSWELAVAASYAVTTDTVNRRLEGVLRRWHQLLDESVGGSGMRVWQTWSWDSPGSPE